MLPLQYIVAGDIYRLCLRSQRFSILRDRIVDCTGDGEQICG
jgi:hypothetical protein